MVVSTLAMDGHIAGKASHSLVRVGMRLDGIMEQWLSNQIVDWENRDVEFSAQKTITQISDRLQQNHLDNVDA